MTEEFQEWVSKRGREKQLGEVKLTLIKGLEEGATALCRTNTIFIREEWVKEQPSEVIKLLLEHELGHLKICQLAKTRKVERLAQEIYDKQFAEMIKKIVKD